MAKKDQNTDTFQDVEVIEELSIEQKAELLVIDSLTKAEITKAAIEQYKKEYMALEIKSLDDKEAITQVSTARKLMKSKRSQVDNMRKSLNADALLHQKKVNATATQIIEEIREIEQHLIDQEAWVEKEQQRIAAEIKQKAEEALKYRIKKLVDAGLVFDGEVYALGKINQSQQQIGAMDGESYDLFLERVVETKQALDKIAEEEAEAERQRIAAENKKAEEDEAERLRLQKVADDLAAENKKKDDEMAAMAKKMADMEAAEAKRLQEIEDAKRIEEEERIFAQQQEELEKILEKPKEILQTPATPSQSYPRAGTPPLPENVKSTEQIVDENDQKELDFIQAIEDAKYDLTIEHKKSDYPEIQAIYATFYNECCVALEKATVALEALKPTK